MSVAVGVECEWDFTLQQNERINGLCCSVAMFAGYRTCLADRFAFPEEGSMTTVDVACLMCVSRVCIR